MPIIPGERGGIETAIALSGIGIGPAMTISEASVSFTISLTFAPTGTGNRTVSVMITGNTSGNPRSVSLSGTGTNYSLTAATGPTCLAGGNCSTSAMASAGQPATYNLQVTPISGFNGTVALTCKGAPRSSTVPFLLPPFPRTVLHAALSL
jgi:hypothetical protein